MTEKLCAAAALLLLLACNDSHTDSQPSSDAAVITPGTLAVGAQCTDSSQCEYLACIKVAEGRSVCSVACNDASQCPAAPNWACLLPTAVDVKVCACQSDADEEVCGDGLDNDCDGVVDCPDAQTDAGTTTPPDGGTTDAGGCATGDCSAGPPSCATNPGLCPACEDAADCDDGIACTEDHCRARACVHVPKDALCAPAEVCDPRMDGCTRGTACANDADCADEDACTQLERCDVARAVCRFNLLDGDADEHFPLPCGGDDCDDTDPSAFPGALDVCDGRDNDCNGSVNPESAALLCAAGRACTSGSCACLPGLMECRGRCFGAEAFTSNPYNCGACGVACGVGMECVQNTCVDIDECAADPGPCAADATCLNTERSYSCVCIEGYVMGATACVDRNECSANTDNCDDAPNACVNSAGSYGCECPDGYRGDGVGSDGCQDIDECAEATDDCSGADVVCGNTSGSFRCIRRALAVAAGDAHSCAIVAGGAVKCWGYNDYGQLGLGDTAARGDNAGEMGNALPAVSLGTGRSATALAAGAFHTCALLDDHSVKCWGNNDTGQLGLGNLFGRGDQPGEMGDALPAVDLGSGRTATAITAGGNHTCALLDDATVKCWGFNDYGQLGRGNLSSRGGATGEMGDDLAPINLGTGRTVLAIDAGAQHTCALLDNATIKCWGYGANGQLGLGSMENIGDDANEMGANLAALNLGTGRTARAIAAAAYHSCAVLDTGAMKCWGYNEFGQLGLGSTVTRGDEAGEMGVALPAVALGAARTALALGCGSLFSCARLDNARVKCWGDGAYGALGLGSQDVVGDAPGEMGDALAFVELGTGRTVVQLASGSNHSCALLDDGTIKCWGNGASGQLGLGESSSRGDEPGEMGDALPAVDLGL